ncbi:hypothetical protein K435DRAFT_865914 [Dendrothele bispora CBS 962.96]|uniref:Uncharacterized protein n=1 Tax=Dendrothele bispora (strain CBS 962.96) TaxID=1314807 RepID=A0A4S8LJL0_DENBC|nr:hypothetical protein K435DRAFT_865914 [Dendrothele bispora CBS 962.96]
MAETNFKIKREREAEDDIDLKPKRACTQKANITNQNLVGSGGFFDSQTSDTQYFGFSESQSTGRHGSDGLESQHDFGQNDNDNYAVESQSQEENDFDYPQSQMPCNEEDDDNKFQYINSDFKHLSPITGTPAIPTSPQDHQNLQVDGPSTSYVDSQGHKWGPGTINQEKLNQILRIKYGDAAFLCNIVEKHEAGEDAKNRWQSMRESEPDNSAPRLALFRLLRNAGITDSSDSFSQLNPLRRGHIMVASYLIRIASKLVQHGGQAQDIHMLRDVIEDGRIFLNIADKLVDKEHGARDWIARE